ncbi:putative O-methyltransferase YrrM [Flavobacterium arsenatis]|uniref:O-methyltransferase YrrM n=1 Tax=Flavobacterium arsenatis TaxID=1484332 RepID=A0ABU1TR09_9FLAO|nr:class I SAM-dependent methyltransferase [Flavobacterium arsenatis]MDR6968336.1 putative O-methyltransferase YrrM [Flavobacterium arsenatis]
MQHIFKSYLKFLWNSTNAHGVHSPFVFDLVRNCFYDKTDYAEYKILDDYRNSFLQNKSTIEVTDFGAGSRIFKSNARPINKIAENAGISPKDAKLLFRVVHYFQPEKVLEIGTSLGLATSALAVNNSAEIITLEGCQETAKVAQFQFQKFNFNVNSIVTEFSKHFNTCNLQPTTYNLIYFDGNHSKEATLNYFELLLPTISNETVWIFDDIHWSEGMEEAWEIIKKHPKVTVTIDTFQWGLVFFRKEQVKEHFIVRTSKSFFLDNFLGIKNLWGLLK